MSTSGFLLVDKPAGITSHDVIDKLRRITGERRIGHAGTLDPFATGLLIVAVGREATKEISKYVGMDKTYEAEFVLGATTETLDPESEVIMAYDLVRPDQIVRTDSTTPPLFDSTTITAVMQSFTGNIQQIPPMYSAIKRAGKKMYELARQGITVELEPRPVTIYEFFLTDKFTEPIPKSATTAISVNIRCSSGTYVRALARDLAQKLGTTGYVQQLRRTTIGKATIEQAIALGDINTNNWQTLVKKEVWRTHTPVLLSLHRTYRHKSSIIILIPFGRHRCITEKR